MPAPTLRRTCTVLLACVLSAPMLVVASADAQTDSSPVVVLHRRAIELARQGEHHEAYGLLLRLAELEPRDRSILQDLAAVAAWAQDCSSARRALERLEGDAPIAPYAAVPVAWCLLDADDPERALRLLQPSAEAYPDDVELLLPLAHALARVGRPDEALRMVGRLLAERPEDVDALFLRAELRARADELAPALADYQRILEIDATRDRARVQAAWILLDLEALAAAERMAEPLAGDAAAELRQEIASAWAAREIGWGYEVPHFSADEPDRFADRAIERLEAVRRHDPDDRRALFDLILAHRLRGDMERVLELMATARGRGWEIPVWVREAEAGALLALHRYEAAEAAYRDVLEERPGEYQPSIGLYYTLSETRRWPEAEAVLDSIEAADPAAQLSVEIERGWMLLYQGRTARGLEHFRDLLVAAPANPEVRRGVAQALLWLDRPRTALSRLDDVLTRTTVEEPFVDNVDARLARVSALMSLDAIGRAREEARELAERYPNNQHVERTLQSAEQLWGPELAFGVRYRSSDQGLDETVATTEASLQAWSAARLYAQWLATRSSEERYDAGDLDRVGVGGVLQLGRDVRLRQQLTTDLGGDDEWDSSTRLTLLPSDLWTLEVGHASDAPEELPLRARAAGIGAEWWNAAVVYDDGARWRWRATGSRYDFDDGNERTAVLSALTRTIEVRPVRSQRLTLEVYGSKNTRPDAPYFNPPEDLSVALTDVIEWRWQSSPVRRRVGRLHLTVGVYDQKGFDAEPRGGLLYEEDWSFASGTSLLLGAGAFANVYDGQREYEPLAFLNLRRRF